MDVCDQGGALKPYSNAQIMAMSLRIVMSVERLAVTEWLPTDLTACSLRTPTRLRRNSWATFGVHETQAGISADG